MNNFKIFLWLILLPLSWLVVTLTQPPLVFADDRCGPGYECWPEAGGNAALYSDCFWNGSYCQGSGTVNEYCSCEGSSNCSCEIGPGTECPSQKDSEWDCYCEKSGNACDYDERGEACTDYTTPGDPYTDPEDICGCSEVSDQCGSPTGTSVLGCCYASEPEPSAEPEPSPSTEPLTPYCDVQANDSDTNITVSAYEQYQVSWLGMNVASCTLNGVLTNFDGAANYVNGPGSYVYTYSCTGSYGNCSDAVGVTVDDCATTVDIKANGSDTDITTYEDYTIGWSSSGADTCSVTRNGTPLWNTKSGSQVQTAGIDGIYDYLLICDNLCGDVVTDDVTVTVDLCGDGVCAGFENCLDCEADCGVCPNQWFQVWGGHLFAGLTSGNAIISPISDQATYPYLSAEDRVGHALSDGIALTGGGAISAEGRISARVDNTAVIGSAPTRFRETYSYFARQYSLGLSPTDDFSGTAGNAQKPTYDPDKAYYYHQGDLTIQEAWSVAADESYVIFVDGQLNLTDPSSVGQLISVQEGGFLALIVAGDINIDSTVGNANLADTTPNLAGLFVADGTITVEAAASPPDKRFVGEGSFIGWTDVALNRTFPLDNHLYPAETFIYRPDFITNTPEEMKRAQRIWQETN